MNTVLCLGEIVIDRIRNKPDFNSDAAFENHPAGVPANVAVGLARQNVKSALIGRLGGADAWGSWLRQVFINEGVDVSGVILDANRNTRVIHNERQADGSRKFLGGYLSNCADVQLSPQDLNAEQFRNAAALYFSSTALCQEPIASATDRAIELAKANNLLVVCDVNYWPAMWKSEEEARKAFCARLPQIDVLKFNRYELSAVTGYSELQGAWKVRSKYNVPLVLRTDGENGTLVFRKEGMWHAGAFPVVVKEPAGAGDAFVAGVISKLLPLLSAEKSRRDQLCSLSVEQVLAAVEHGNVCGAMVASRFGAMGAMPRSEELERFLKEGSQVE